MDKAKILMALAGAAIRIFNSNRMRKLAHFLIDNLETQIEEDGVVDWKDKVILPLLGTARVAFNLPDDDEAYEK